LGTFINHTTKKTDKPIDGTIIVGPIKIERHLFAKPIGNTDHLT